MDITSLSVSIAPIDPVSNPHDLAEPEEFPNGSNTNSWIARPLDDVRYLPLAPRPGPPERVVNSSARFLGGSIHGKKSSLIYSWW